MMRQAIRQDLAAAALRQGLDQARRVEAQLEHALADAVLLARLTGRGRDADQALGRSYIREALAADRGIHAMLHGVAVAADGSQDWSVLYARRHDGSIVEGTAPQRLVTDLLAQAPGSGSRPFLTGPGASACGSCDHGPTVLAINVPAEGPGSHMRITRIELPVTDLARGLHSYSGTGAESAIVVAGKVIASSDGEDEKLVEVIKKAEARISAAARNLAISVDIEDGEYLVFPIDISGLNEKIYLSVRPDRERVSGILWSIVSTRIAVTALFGFSLLAVLFLLINNTIERPFRQVKDIIRLLGMKDTSWRIPTGSGNPEIDEIFQHLEKNRRLVVDLERMRRQIAEQVSLLAEKADQTASVLGAIDAVRDGILIYDGDGVLKYVNKAACELLGLESPEAAIGLSRAEIAPSAVPAGHEFLQAEVFPAIARQGVWVGTCDEFRAADGRMLPIETSIQQSPAGDLIYVLRDMTERRRAERQQAELERQLRDSQKLQAVGRLAGGMAHDFNNILGSVLGFSTFLRDDLDKDSAARGYAVNIIQAVSRARDLTQQMLTFSRASAVTMVPLRLDLALQSTMQMVRAAVPSTTAVEVHAGVMPPDRGLIIDGNETQMTQMVMNLCLNGSDALGGRTGRLTVRLQSINGTVAEQSFQMEKEAGYPQVGSIDRHLSYAVITVADTGSGMPPEVASRIFDPFFTTKNSKGAGSGTGLGLSMVHGIVLQHKGAISVQTAPAKGSRFDVYLPLSTHDRVAEVPEDDAPTELVGSYKVLLVEDEVGMADMVLTAFERYGYETAAFESAEDLLDFLAEEPLSTWDVLLTDYALPRMNGLSLISEIHRLRPGLPAILYTGYGRDLSEKFALERGASAMFLKPVDPRQIAGAIVRLCAGARQDHLQDA